MTERAYARMGHARIGRKIIVFDKDRGAGGYGVCAWDECDTDATSLHQVRTHEHPPGVSCETVDSGRAAGGRHVWYAFCTERHKQYWLACSGTRAHDTQARRGRIYGNLPPGYRLGVL